MTPAMLNVYFVSRTAFLHPETKAGWSLLLAGWRLFLAGWNIFLAGWSLFLAGWSFFLSGLSFAAHSSELTPLSSWRLWWVWADIPLTPGSSHLTPHTTHSDITPHPSLFTTHTSSLTHQIAALKPQSSDLPSHTRHTSHQCRDSVLA